MNLIEEFSIHKESHGIKIKVYENFVMAMITMPMDEFVKYIKFGKDAERKAIQNLMLSIFKDEIKGKKIFNSEDDINEYLIKKGVTPAGGGANYCKNMIFEIDSNKFEDSLERIIQYIKIQSANYEISSKKSKKDIANDVFKKYFR